MEKKATFGAGCFWGVEAAFIEKRGLATCTPRLAGVAGATA
jgi:peptide methionine sulfoxide reductase MsrA